MKKILIILLPLALILLSSCNKQEPAKDLDTCVKKLHIFNKTFADFNADGVISKEKVGKKDSEYAQLKKIANEYYEALNKVNDNIAEEKEKIKKGDAKINEYETAYKQELEKRKAEIEKATSLFMENLNKMK